MRGVSLASVTDPLPPPARSSASAAWNSSARSSSTASARSGSVRTSAIAVFSVLNRKCGRIRDCSSARRAVVSAGTVALARRRSHSNIVAAIAAPASAGPRPFSEDRMAPEASTRRSATPVDVSQAAIAPNPIAANHCSPIGASARGRFSAHRVSSQISTPGSATLEPAAVRPSHTANDGAAKTMPIAITPCT